MTTSLSPAEVRLDRSARVKQFAQLDADDTPAWLTHGTVPALDGLRGLSILVVLASHLALRREHGFPWLPCAGEMGVEMFFVISGFLITLLLLRERGRTGSVALGAFYARRSLRILPAYLCFLAVVLALQLAGALEVPARAWVGVLTYSSSLYPVGCWDVAHSWSLSVEEHFYLLWPLLFVGLRARPAVLTLAAYVLATPLLRVALYFVRQEVPSLSSAGYFTPTRMDAIAVGCLLALFASRPAFLRATRLSGRRALLLVAGGVLTLAAIKFGGERFGHYRVVWAFVEFVADTVKPILMAGVLWCCVRADGPLARFLNAAPLRLLGVLSYSIYLWQQIFLHPDRQHWTCDVPTCLGLTLLCALASYTFVERPFLALKARFHGRRNLATDGHG